MKTFNLLTEYLFNPIGVDFSKPILLWNVTDCEKQSAYQIKVYVNEQLKWDSGKVNSSSTRCICPLDFNSRDYAIWTLVVYDENNNPSEESKSHFEIGLKNKEDWKAQWITGNYKVNKNIRYPVDYFQKEFDACDVKKARLYITSCGLYEARINDDKAGSFVLSPGITNFRKRLQYQTIDITNLLKEGKNKIEVALADGLFRGSCGAWALKNQYGTETKFLAQLEITHNEGKVETICSDESWNWSNDGPILFADKKDGEIVDNRKSPSYSKNAKLTNYSVIPSASNNVLLEEHETFKAKLIKTPKGKTVLDFGQNIAGYLSFKVNAKDGDVINLRFGELIDNDGEFTQRNIQCRNDKKGLVTPLQEVKFTCKDGLNEYKTKFAIFGFQYVLVESDIEISVDDFTAIAVYSTFQETLKFDSSNELLNKLVESTRWSAKNNHADLPTDCPTRERHGWTGDAQIFANTAGYFFNYASFARKYQRMLVDEQKKNGKYTQIVPGGGVDFYMTFMDGSSGWSDAGILIPYRMWKLYGDEKIIKDNFTSMKKYADLLIKHLGKWYPTASSTGVKGKDKKYLVNFGQAYGEWAEPDDVHHMTWKDCAVPHPEVATAYTSHVLSLFSEICEHLGDKESAQKYLGTSNKVKKSYQALSNTKKFSLDTDRQARLVRPLYFNLLNEEQKKYAQQRLVKALDNYNWRLGTGFLSTPLILFALQEIDPELAYKLLENEEMPGWLFMPKSGANTIWEAWEGNTTPQGGIASLDHYSKGAVCEWVFRSMCGINVAGENKFEIKPLAGGHFTYASSEYQSIYGMVKSSWKKENNKIIYQIEIPANTKANIVIGKINELVGPGIHKYEVKENG